MGAMRRKNRAKEHDRMDEQPNRPIKAVGRYANRRLYNTVNPYAKYSRPLRVLFIYVIAPLVYFVVLVPVDAAWSLLRKNEAFRIHTDVLYARFLGQSRGRVLALLGGCWGCWGASSIG